VLSVASPSDTRPCDVVNYIIEVNTGRDVTNAQSEMLVAVGVMGPGDQSVIW